jgi:hypothetical protein
MISPENINTDVYGCRFFHKGNLKNLQKAPLRVCPLFDLPGAASMCFYLRGPAAALFILERTN